MRILRHHSDSPDGHPEDGDGCTPTDRSVDGATPPTGAAVASAVMASVLATQGPRQCCADALTPAQLNGMGADEGTAYWARQCRLTARLPTQCHRRGEQLQDIRPISSHNRLHSAPPPPPPPPPPTLGHARPQWWLPECRWWWRWWCTPPTPPAPGGTSRFNAAIHHLEGGEWTTTAVHVKYARVQHLRASWLEQRLHLAKLKETSERVVAWEAALDETHALQRQQEGERVAARKADTAALVHVVISITDGQLPDFAHRILTQRNPRVKLIVYNKTESVESSNVVTDGDGNEWHDVPFTAHTRNCASFVEYVRAHHERLPDVVIMLKTNLVGSSTAAFMIQTALRNEHDVDSHWWPPWQGRTLVFVRCHPRWAWSVLYRQLCPCADHDLRYTASNRQYLLQCVDDDGLTRQKTSRSGLSPPLVTEVFSEGLFAFSRSMLRQQPREYYERWKRDLFDHGESHQPCLDEWVTMFDEPGDAPWGRDNFGVPVWKASPSRLLYALNGSLQGLWPDPTAKA